MPHSAQLAFNLPFDSARWKGAKYSQYFGLSLKPGNQWCFLLIREFVGKCSWNFRGSSLLGSSKFDWESARSRGSFSWVVTLGDVKGVVPLSSYLDQVVTGGRRSQEGHFLDWSSRPRGSSAWVGTWIALSLGVIEGKRVFLLGDYSGWPSLGVAKVKRVVLLIGYYVFS
ncbi:hypothetical protein EDB89DRAFT_1911697 [Lactarius sanguifluus]|nr:hypothetical protein EDB89DRAFT_1911697 [Lactarius sanguifluus]